MRGLMLSLCVFAILAVFSHTADALTFTVTPKSAEVGQPVVLTVTGLAPYTELIFEVSWDGGRSWWPIAGNGAVTTFYQSFSVYRCNREPCQLVVNSPTQETAWEFRVVVWDPQGGHWVYGQRTNQIVSWTAGPGGGTDLRADFNWNRSYGGSVVQVASGKGNLTGNFARWQFTGTAENGGPVRCSGGLDPGRRPAPDAPGTIQCEARWGSPANVWQCQGQGRMETSSSQFAGGHAWFGTFDQGCVGTITEDGKTSTLRFGPVYIRSGLGLPLQ